MKKQNNAFIVEIKRIGDEWKKQDRIFTSKDGGNMNPNTCGQILRKIVKKYQLEKISFHELRHTCATLLINNGMNSKSVSERLGHSYRIIDLYLRVFFFCSFSYFVFIQNIVIMKKI